MVVVLGDHAFGDTNIFAFTTTRDAIRDAILLVVTCWHALRIVTEPKPISTAALNVRVQENIM